MYRPTFLHVSPRIINWYSVREIVIFGSHRREGVVIVLEIVVCRLHGRLPVSSAPPARQIERQKSRNKDEDTAEYGHDDGYCLPGVGITDYPLLCGSLCLARCGGRVSVGGGARCLLSQNLTLEGACCHYYYI